MKLFSNSNGIQFSERTVDTEKVLNTKAERVDFGYGSDVLTQIMWLEEAADVIGGTIRAHAYSKMSGIDYTGKPVYKTEMSRDYFGKTGTEAVELAKKNYEKCAANLYKRYGIIFVDASKIVQFFKGALKTVSKKDLTKAARFVYRGTAGKNNTPGKGVFYELTDLDAREALA